MSEITLPVGTGGDRCARCGWTLDKCKQDITRARKKRWKIFCSALCFRLSQTKYPNLTARERQINYTKSGDARKRQKRLIKQTESL